MVAVATIVFVLSTATLSIVALCLFHSVQKNWASFTTAPADVAEVTNGMNATTLGASTNEHTYAQEGTCDRIIYEII